MILNLIVLWGREPPCYSDDESSHNVNGRLMKNKKHLVRLPKKNVKACRSCSSTEMNVPNLRSNVFSVLIPCELLFLQPVLGVHSQLSGHLTIPRG